MNNEVNQRQMSIEEESLNRLCTIIGTLQGNMAILESKYNRALEENKRMSEEIEELRKKTNTQKGKKGEEA